MFSQTELVETKPADESSLSFVPGQVLGDQFVINRFLGAGGMGEVYAAFDRHVGEMIALKTICAKYSHQPQMLARLKKEVQLARKLRHPNVCAVHGVHPLRLHPGVETFAISMALLDGEPLSAMIPKGLWPLDEVIEVLGQVASGVQAVHDLNILHRDLKPGNVMILTAKDGRRTAIITDFGVAHQMNEALGSRTQSILGTKAIVGTTPYMAPEQLRGEGASKLTDVYSLGVIAFEMVTGRLPFEGETALAVALRRLKQEAPSPRDFQPKLPQRWDLIIRASLSSNPSERPPSPAMFLKLLHGEESAFLYWVRQQRRRAFLSSAAVAMLSGSYGVWIATRPQVHPAGAVAAYKRGVMFAQRRDEVGLQEAMRELQSAVISDPNYAEAWAALANAYCASAHYAFMDPKTAGLKAEQAARKALALNHNLAAALAALAYTQSIDLHRWKSAEGLFKRAISAGPPDALAHTWFAAFLGRAGRFNEAIAQAQAGVDLEPTLYAVQNQLAYEYYRGRQFRKYYEKAVELVRMHPTESGSHQTLARALHHIGMMPDALKEVETAITYGDSPAVRASQAIILTALNRETHAKVIGRSVLNYWRQNSLDANLVVTLMAALKDYDAVMRVLDHSYNIGDSTVLACATNPELDNLRARPRYREFLARLGFDMAEIERTTPTALL